MHALTSLCAQHGVRDVVLCPGSRSAPLTLAFLRHGSFRCRTFSDERSAAFIALGIAQASGAPVALVCTSGTAAYNFAPAVAEAFFQHVPLLVLTADRPAEWIDQFDGQTIRQAHLYGQHVKKYFEAPSPEGHNSPDAQWHLNRLLNEAIQLTLAQPPGPIHFNFPFREPLYGDVPSSPPPAARAIRVASPHIILSSDEWSTRKQALQQFNRILVVPGQQQRHDDLLKAARLFQKDGKWTFAGDILSNFHGLPGFVRHADTFLGQLSASEKESLRPDLLITFGKSLVAKNLKLFLRQYKPKQHWHLDTSGTAADTFQGLTDILPVSPLEFFTTLAPAGHKSEYADLWQSHETKAEAAIQSFFNEKTSGEFSAVQQLISSLPIDCDLHLANSMSVRYANHIGLTPGQSGVCVYSNRGTSGIDGCTSTAAGHSLYKQRTQVLLTGDLAFFYDRNAFWHNYPLPDLRVVVLNNHGGIIFNLIDGPSSQAESQEYFVTQQRLKAGVVAKEFGMEYFTGDTIRWDAFFEKNTQAKILEIEGGQSENKAIFEAFRNHIKKVYATHV